MKVRELRSEAEIEEAYHIMCELHDAPDEMIPASYRLFALRVNGAIAALADAQVLTNRYYGRHFYGLVMTKENSPTGERGRLHRPRLRTGANVGASTRGRATR